MPSFCTFVHNDTFTELIVYFDSLTDLAVNIDTLPAHPTPLLQRSTLTGGGSPLLETLVEETVSAEASSHTHMELHNIHLYIFNYDW